ncbi:MAG: IS200/IS605 family accessory protein TnpB-related protein, partial [Gammaproteobacteria bacterium]
MRLCFGSRKLFRAQFALEDNGYASLDAWRDEWRAARSNQFFVIGSHEETSGCQGCVATRNADGSFDLRLRLPDALAQAHGKYVALHGIRFAYGRDRVDQALGKFALSYRFLRDAKGWRVFATVKVEAPRTLTTRLAGAVGIDINADHLALAELNRHGNLVRAKRLPCLTYGATSAQAEARIGDAAVTISEYAAATGKPVVMEDLEFSTKKADLAESAPHYARMLSSVAYHKTLAAVRSACFRAGVEFIQVNPAYTSIIGTMNHARVHGISVHQGAAFAIARRALGLSESPT